MLVESYSSSFLRAVDREAAKSKRLEANPNQERRRYNKGEERQQRNISIHSSSLGSRDPDPAQTPDSYSCTVRLPGRDLCSAFEDFRTDGIMLTPQNLK
ncbi:hypothetical protein KQX54_015997 [Cotesia glomerata]|uniref:Uncharacterized protein n=1 Tax=Cotesia glomerata TaxID=32391 RepID=A0AAV7IRA1_COTGL|nr:hypothetical protein KQX54_015997 [Cotesia glomerata]